MSRIVTVCLVLALASVSYGEWVIPNTAFNPRGTLITSWEEPEVEPISGWGPCTEIPYQTIGVTDAGWGGQYSLGLGGSIGWGFIGQVSGIPGANGNSCNPADFAANTKLHLDVTTIASEWTPESGFQFGLVINSDLTGWQQADLGEWWNGGMGDRTEVITFDYSAFKTGSSCSWVQIIFLQNSYSDDGSLSTYSYYVDNLRLTPEPATMALMGLGGLALIRRKR